MAFRSKSLGEGISFNEIGLGAGIECNGANSGRFLSIESIGGGIFKL